MGAPQQGLSFKERLHQAIEESNDENGPGTCGHVDVENLSTTLSKSSTSYGEKETADALMSSLRLNSISLLEKVAELLLLEREKADISSEDTENLRKTLELAKKDGSEMEKGLIEKDKEIADLRSRLEAKDEELKELRKSYEILILERLKTPQKVQQHDQEVQVPSSSPLLNPLRPPELQPRPPVLQRKAPPLPFSPKPVTLAGGGNLSSSSSSRCSGHHNQSQHHLRSDSPPQLSPAITPRPPSSHNISNHPILSISDGESCDLDLDLEAPPSASKLPQKRSMSPYNTSPHNIKKGSICPGDSPQRGTRVYPAANASTKHFLNFHRNSSGEQHRSYSNISGNSDFYNNGMKHDNSSLSPRENDIFDFVPVTNNPNSKEFLVSTSSEDSDRFQRNQNNTNNINLNLNLNIDLKSNENNQISSKKSNELLPQPHQPRRHFSKHYFLKEKPKVVVPVVIPSSPSPVPPSPVLVVVNTEVNKTLMTTPTTPINTTTIIATTPTNNALPSINSVALAELNPLDLKVNNVSEEIDVKPKTEPEEELPENTLAISEKLNCMTTRFPYYINETTEDQMSEMLRQQQQEDEEESAGKNVEVPKWRIKIYKPLDDPENYGDIEELTEAVFLKRHLRLEIDERRRKRWDSQRVREETYLEKLKRRMQERERQKIKRRKAAGRRPGGGGNESDDEIEFIHPSSEDIHYIRVGDDIPISIFGHPMPITEKSTFEIPWTPPSPPHQATELNSPPHVNLNNNNNSMITNNNNTTDLSLSLTPVRDLAPSGHEDTSLLLSNDAHHSSSSSVSSLPSLPSPTVIPHLRKAHSNSNPSPIPGGPSGYSIITMTKNLGNNLPPDLPPIISNLPTRIVSSPTINSNNNPTIKNNTGQGSSTTSGNSDLKR